MLSNMRYDLDLFAALNESWADRPIVPRPPAQDPASMGARARTRIQRIVRQLDLAPGRRVLEVGCGRGHLSRQLATTAGVEVVGLDIFPYPEWDDETVDGVEFVAGDVSERLGLDGLFDGVYSISVWEHLEHPAAALDEAWRLLRPGGTMFLQAQLRFGPKASHRYREVFFPWPHLLFEPEVFEDYYVSIGREPMRPAFVNAWTAMHYRFHLDRVGFETLWFSTPQPWFDERFYEEHRERLSIHPVWDLSHDAVMVRARKPLDPADEHVPAAAGVQPDES